MCQRGHHYLSAFHATSYGKATRVTLHTLTLSSMLPNTSNNRPVNRGQNQGLDQSPFPCHGVPWSMGAHCGLRKVPLEGSWHRVSVQGLQGFHPDFSSTTSHTAPRVTREVVLAAMTHTGAKSTFASLPWATEHCESFFFFFIKPFKPFLACGHRDGTVNKTMCVPCPGHIQRGLC